MEVRCGSCNKLFRVADEKITGKGIKFACTRCSSSVKITREDFENYTLSQTAVSALDLFTPKAKPQPSVALETEGTPSEGPAGIVEPAPEETAPARIPSDELPGRDFSSPPGPDFLRERKEPDQPDAFSFEEPAPPEPQLSLERDGEPASVFEERQSEPPGEAPSETQPDFSWEPEAKPEIGLNAGPSPDLQRELAPLLAAEPEQKPETQPEAEPERPAEPPQQTPQPIPKPEPTAAQEAASIPHADSAAKPISPAKPAAAPRVAPVAASKAAARPAPPAATVIGASPPAPSRSGQKAGIAVAAFLALSLAGAGAFLYLRSPAPAVKESPQLIATIEGLSVVNSAGSLEPNGDLLITGSVTNATDRERPVWYIVVTVFDANNTVLRTIKLLNGRQLYTRGDFDILAKRGRNVQELMTETLRTPAAVIPPKGNIAFEARYFQPPAGISSFNAELQPVDPARLLKEAAEEAK